MKTFKKIMFMILALLPILLVVYGIGVGLFADASAGLIPMGVVDITDGVLVVEPNTWADYLLTPLQLENTGSEGIAPVMLQSLEFLKINAGLPINLPVVMVVFYYIYMLGILFFDLIYDLLTWVIRKIKELFE